MENSFAHSPQSAYYLRRRYIQILFFLLSLYSIMKWYMFLEGKHLSLSSIAKYFQNARFSQTFLTVNGKQNTGLISH